MENLIIDKWSVVITKDIFTGIYTVSTLEMGGAVVMDADRDAAIEKFIEAQNYAEMTKKFLEFGEKHFGIK